MQLFKIAALMNICFWVAILTALKIMLWIGIIWHLMLHLVMSYVNLQKLMVFVIFGEYCIVMQDSIHRHILEQILFLWQGLIGFIVLNTILILSKNVLLLLLVSLIIV